MAASAASASLVDVACDAAPILALARLLDSLVETVIAIPADVYSARPPAAVSGSIGAHVRHSLDHISALLKANPSATLSYDHRQRGTAVETDPSAALRQLLRLKAAVARWAPQSLAEPVQVACLIDRRGESVVGWSSLARELAFVLSHTIHHQAMIALLMAMHGLNVPEQFGVAPSTPIPS
jgi:uncharacterized damage-inducible protein DinB